MKSSPTPPDPYQTANAQTASNLATAAQQNQYNIQNAATQNQYNRTNALDAQRASMVDQTNPYGTTRYSQTGTSADGTPTYGVTTTLNPDSQRLFDQSNALRSGQLGIASQLLNSGQGAFSGRGPDLSYNGTTAALDALNHARLDPYWQQQSDLNESRLAAQGLTPGMAGYDNVMRNFNIGRNDAYNSANLADYALSSQNALAAYNSPLNSYLSLTQGTTPQMPGAANVSTPGVNIANPNVANPNVAGTNVSGLIEQNYQQESQNANAYNGQLAGLIGTGVGLAAAPFTGGASLGLTKMGGLFGGGSPSGYGTGR
ncbi:hypothetical protein ACE10X_13220 [Bradyrhizobium sp. Pha-3]|uniref:hypothetical protein n=1 Tax=Bradyrhizobium sp. Pha-3 TaxID=208375 RepID=UPI0035D518F5